MANYSMTDQGDSGPWYRQFWAWFVLTPLLIVVMVAGTFVTVAFRYADDVVSDNYYKDGRMINQVLEQDEAARAINLGGSLNVDTTLGEIHAALHADTELPERLLIAFSHPVSEDLDQHFILRRMAPGRYRADLGKPLAYRWYLRLFPLADGVEDGPAITHVLEHSAPWRLSGEIDLQKGSVIQFAR